MSFTSWGPIDLLDVLPTWSGGAPVLPIDRPAGETDSPDVGDPALFEHNGPQPGFPPRQSAWVPAQALPGGPVSCRGLPRAQPGLPKLTARYQHTYHVVWLRPSDPAAMPVTVGPQRYQSQCGRPRWCGEEQPGPLTIPLRRHSR
eukprot:883562-Amphidinium_carterae.1